MVSRRWLIRCGVLAAAAGVGLLAGRMLTAHPPTAPGALSSGATGPATSTNQEPYDVAITASMTVTDATVGAPLIATRQLASQTPPATVRDCRALSYWAYQAGAARTGTVLHTLSIRAGRTVRVVLDRIYAQQLPVTVQTRRPGVEEQLVRLHCRTEAESQWTPRDERYDLDSVTTIGAKESPPDESIYGSHIFDLNAGGEATLTVPVEPIYGPWQYDYVLRGTVLVNGVRYEFTADAGGSPFRWSEDLAGMGYVPAQHYWTLLPTPRLVRCPETVDDSATSPAPSCGPD